MGYLHEGHLSLVRQCRSENDFCSVSIFVNPTQFNDPNDLQTYPVDLDHDLARLRELGVDLVYLPGEGDLYHRGSNNNRIWLVPERLDDYLCGASRPGHFRGVLTVVLKLFQQLQPHRAYFGKKDYQQARLIQEMAETFFVPVEVRTGEIVREKDGLALSSRNVNLTPEARGQAPILYDSLDKTRAHFAAGERRAQKLRAFLRQQLERASLGRLDYAEVVDRDELRPIEGEVAAGKSLLAVAVYFGPVRLIDNMEL
jgi:pantoate--beta-alanine ligase